jgi:drug/metabolite transporter (DMT)-like permease
MRNKGFIFILLSACGYGIMPIFATIAYANGTNVYELLFLRFTIALVLFIIYLQFSGRIKSLIIPRKGLVKLFILGGVFFALTSITIYKALYYLSPSLAEIAYFTYPAVVVFMSSLIYKEKLDFKKILSIVIMFSGVILTVNSQAVSFNWKGLLYALSCSFVYSLYVIYIKDDEVQNIDTYVVSFYIMLFGDVTFLTCGIFTSSLHFNITTEGYAAIGIIAVFSTIIGLGAFNIGSQYLTSSEIAITASFEPVVTIIADIFILKNAAQFKVITGACLILLSIALLSFKRRVFVGDQNLTG